MSGRYGLGLQWVLPVCALAAGEAASVAQLPARLPQRHALAPQPLDVAVAREAEGGREEELRRRRDARVVHLLRARARARAQARARARVTVRFRPSPSPNPTSPTLTLTYLLRVLRRQRARV